MFDCCICFAPTNTPAPLCVNWESHTGKTCTACVAMLKSHNHYCPICREPLAGHVYPEPEPDIWFQVVAQDGTVTWEAAW